MYSVSLESGSECILVNDIDRVLSYCKVLLVLCRHFSIKIFSYVFYVVKSTARKFLRVF